MKNKTAMVFGATGLIGGHLLSQLEGDTVYAKVYSVTRKPVVYSHKKIKNIVIDFDNISHSLNAIACDVIFCALGTTIANAGSKEQFRKVDYEYVFNLAKWAASQKVDQFLLVSSLGADLNSKIFYNKTKGEIEQAVLTTSIGHISIFRPSLLLGSRKEFRFGESIAQMLTKVIPFTKLGSLQKLKPIKAQDVANFMIKVSHVNFNNCHSRQNQIYESCDIK